MIRRITPAVLALLLTVPGAVSAQYFGRNKVNYSTFDFKIIQTEHFDVYYYPAEREAALDIARLAERSYFRLSKALNHEFNERKQADKKAEELTKSGKSPHFVQPVKEQIVDG